ncbi:mechanosensitive ion channel family protein [Clostridium sp.]|uniref:mechanosensitive ion channel family protein n=1 Tax=Clostridium sp. TaxID=1506 RepID=UPI003463F8AD
MEAIKRLVTQNIDWDTILNTVIHKTLAIAIIIAIMMIIIKISLKAINNFVDRQSKMKISLDDRKANTIGEILKSIVKYTVYFFGITAILTVLFGPINIAFASIGGVAIGFGAQNLVKDVINGFFIIFEDQFAVGDYVNIGDKGGIVESIGLRLTKLKDFNGDCHIIPNGNITIITNHSRNNMRVLVDIDVAYEEDIDNVIKTLNEVCEEFGKKNENIVEGPTVIGVTALKDSAVTIRVCAKALSMTQWECEANLRKDIKQALDKNGIEIPYPKRAIYNVVSNKDN